jgi:RNA polymerase sigma-70 factor (ECF subfamily)
VRRSGHPPEEAQDLTQSFFAYLLETRFVSKASPGKGRFRTFLLACLKNFLSTEHRKWAAAKRGGGQPPLSLEEQRAEARYGREPADIKSPDLLYELSWAKTLLNGALETVRTEFASAGKAELFNRLEPFLHAAERAPSYKATAAALGKTEDAVGAAVQRLRRRYHQALRAQIARTVNQSSEIDDELRHLRLVLRR